MRAISNSSRLISLDEAVGEEREREHRERKKGQRGRGRVRRNAGQARGSGDREGRYAG